MTMPSADPEARSVEVGSIVETRIGDGCARGVWRIRGRVGTAADASAMLVEPSAARETKSAEDEDELASGTV